MSASKDLLEFDFPEIMETFIKNITLKRLDLMFDAFEKYGYTRKWLIENLDRTRGDYTVCSLDTTDTYYVDDEPLFSIATTYNSEQNAVYVGIEYIKPLPEVNNEEL